MILMSKNDEVLAAWDMVDLATTELGARIQVLIDDINNTAGSGLDGPQTENVLARLSSLRDTLNVMGAEPANPIPPVEGEDPSMPS